VRPAAAVNAEKRPHLSLVALDYLRRLGNPRVKMRFDIVEVLLANGQVREGRHLPNAFTLSSPVWMTSPRPTRSAAIRWGRAGPP
jgi:hypothetical protein